MTRGHTTAKVQTKEPPTPVKPLSMTQLGTSGDPGVPDRAPDRTSSRSHLSTEVTLDASHPSYDTSQPHRTHFSLRLFHSPSYSCLVPWVQESLSIHRTLHTLNVSF